MILLSIVLPTINCTIPLFVLCVGISQKFCHVNDLRLNCHDVQ